MLSDFVWVVFIDEDWDVPPSGFTRKRLLLALSAELGKVGSLMLCVERPLSPATFWRNGDKIREAIGGRRGLRRVADHLYLTTPWMFLHERLAPLMPGMVQLNRWALRRQIERDLSSLGENHKRRIAWVFHPYQKDMIGVVSEQLSVFECYDEYAALIPSRRVAAKQYLYEDHILERTDIVLTTARHLYQTRREKNRNTYLVQNGVDYELFTTALDPLLPLPKDIADIPRPRIGYVGAVNGRLDFGMVDAIARHRPDWNFLFIGPNNGDRKLRRRPDFLSVQQRPNVHFLGHRPYARIPAYLKAFDVCVIPYLVNDCTVSLYPLKLNEYLAAGRPVVSTDFAVDLEDFSDIVWIVEAGDWQSFQQALAMAMQGDERRRLQGLEAARANSWAERAKQIVSIVERHLEERL